MKLAHVSKFNRGDGQLGGVEKFAYYLNQVFPDLELYSLADFQGGSQGPDWEIAEQLNAQLLAEQKIDKDTIVIVDGFWGRGLAGKVKTIINVAHGVYIGEAWSNEIFSYADPTGVLMSSREQHKAYQEADIVVAVSQRTQEELWQAYRIVSVKIVNGIDLKIFKPNRKRKRPDLILHVATNGRKQLGLVNAVRAMTRDLRIEHLGIQSGEMEDEAARWQEGAVFLQPSLYEGCSFASLESMACGCVPVAYNAGIWPEVPDKYGIFLGDHHVTAYVRALREALREQSRYKPREWVQENASMQLFASKWRDLVC